MICGMKHAVVVDMDELHKFVSTSCASFARTALEDGPQHGGNHDVDRDDSPQSKMPRAEEEH